TDLLRFPAFDDVLLKLRDVVRHVVNQLHAELFPRLAEYPRKDLAGLVGQELAVAPGKVGRGSHRTHVRLALPAPHRRTGKRPVGELESVPLRRVLERGEVIVAHLVAQPARAGVDQYRDLALMQTHDLRGRPVDDAIDDLDLEKVVARSESPTLVKSA